MGKALAKRIKATILYASETGRSEKYAKMLCEIFKHAFDAKVCRFDFCMFNPSSCDKMQDWELLG